MDVNDVMHRKRARRILGCRLADFAVLADYKAKIKENEKRYYYLDMAKESLGI